MALKSNFFESNKQLILLFALLIGIPLVFYYPSLSYDFLYELDDDWIVVSNDSIKMISYVGWKKGLIYLFFHDQTDFHYHPITYLSMSIDYLLFGTNVMAIKVHNLLLHITSGLLLFTFINLVVKNRWIAFVVALIFLLHPMNIESVAWASCRRQSLFFSYFLASAIAYKIFIAHPERKHRVWIYLASLLLWIISMLAKASAIVMPAVFVLIYLHQNRDSFKLKTIVKHLLPTLPVLVVIVYLNELANARNYLVRDFSYSNFQHLIFAGYTYCFYWAKGIFPYPLAVFYPAPSEHLPLPLHYFWMFFVSCIFIFLLIYHFVKKQHSLFFALGFYTVTILPMLDLIFYPLGDLPMLVANRYFYHTSVGIILYIVLVIYHFVPSKMTRFILVSLYLILLSVLFKIHLPAWKNQITMYEATVKYYPSEEVLYKLAILYNGLGEQTKALYCLNRADTLGTDIWVNNSWPFYQGRSRLYLKAGKYNKALKDIDTAINKSFGKTPHFDSMLEMDKNKILSTMEEQSSAKQ